MTTKVSLQLNRFTHVLTLFSRMLKQGLFPDNYAPIVVKACTELLNLNVGRQVHGIALVSGFVSDSYVQSSLGHMYVKFNQLVDAHKVFVKMPELNVGSWSASVAGYARQGHVSEAREAFDEMGNLGIEPNLVLWNGMIAGSTRVDVIWSLFWILRECI